MEVVFLNFNLLGSSELEFSIRIPTRADLNFKEFSEE
jgi:hypothetical protein